jgi:hypothetical protein
MGDNLWFLTDTMERENTVVSDGLDVLDYHQYIHDLKPSVMMVPLFGSMFNHCKSNIAWIEATFAGAVTVAPAWDEWNRPGILTYENDAQFVTAMEAVLSGKIDVTKTCEASWTYIMDNLRLEKVNEARAKIICDIMNLGSSNDLRG